MDALTKELMVEIDRLRALLRRCQPGADIVDLGNGEIICLHLKSGESFAEIKQGLKDGKANPDQA